MVLKCIAIDKESSSLGLISNYIRLFPGLELLQIFSDIQAAEQFLLNNNIDLVFIEMSMPFARVIRRIRTLQEKLLVIFTVNSKQLPTDLLKLDVVDYLVKPFAYLRFAKAVGKAMSLHEKENAVNPESAIIYIRSTYQLVRVNLDEVEYIESLENYIRIHFTSGKFIMALMPLKKILEKIPPEKFVRIHRSYIISIDKIRNIRNKKVTLSIVELPAGDSYFKNLKGLIK
jgi:DNA-binding LytR/AlgR family response regulator